MTQCALYSEIASNEKSLRIYCENLVLKINHKNGGINTIVDLQNRSDSCMFFGADVIHPTNVTRQHPSIAGKTVQLIVLRRSGKACLISAMVGSGNSSCSTTAVRVCKQYPKQGKCSIETILGMKEMVQELLEYYYEMNNYFPKKVVFYRDGKKNEIFTDEPFDKLFF